MESCVCWFRWSSFKPGVSHVFPMVSYGLMSVFQGHTFCCEVNLA